MKEFDPNYIDPKFALVLIIVLIVAIIIMRINEERKYVKMAQAERNEVIRHIMRMENCTKEDAEEIFADVMNEVEIAISQGDYELAEDIWMGDLGLEVDYLMQVL